LVPDALRNIWNNKGNGFSQWTGKGVDARAATKGEPTGMLKTIINIFDLFLDLFRPERTKKSGPKK
jgi:hypothetical protein